MISVCIKTTNTYDNSRGQRWDTKPSINIDNGTEAVQQIQVL